MSPLVFYIIIFVYRGAVRVTMDLLKLDIVQCPNEYYVQNPFKDTHRCDRKTSYVSSLQF